MPLVVQASTGEKSGRNLLFFPRQTGNVAVASGLKGTSLNDEILKAIDEEIANLRQARAILADSSGRSTGKRVARATSAEPAPRRKLSAKARRAIAEAQRKRWAKVKSQKKAAAPANTARKETAS
jgi:hypothetical protein